MSVDGHLPHGLVPNGLNTNGLVTKSDALNWPLSNDTPLKTGIIVRTRSRKRSLPGLGLQTSNIPSAKGDTARVDTPRGPPNVYSSIFTSESQCTTNHGLSSEISRAKTPSVSIRNERRPSDCRERKNGYITNSSTQSGRSTSEDSPKSKASVRSATAQSSTTHIPNGKVVNVNVAPSNASQDKLYRSLDSEQKEIRILLLDDCAKIGARQLANDIAAAPLSPAILKFRLKTVSLLDPEVPYYEAISYTWGDPKHTSEVIINDRVTKIPASAESTLRAMCATHGHLSVWLDAVCINQADLDERGEQVDMMGEIYSRASRTLIWLGDAMEPNVPTIRTLYEFLDSNMPSSWRSADPSATQDQLLKHTPKHLSPVVAWSFVYAFYSNRWFTRAWVIQEVALARSALCYQGLQVIDWKEVAAVATWLYKRRYKLPKHPKKSALTGIENVAQIWLLGRRKKQKLASLLRLVYTFNCKEPVDMVYATLGMRHKAAQKPGSNSRVIPIYQEPLIEVYAKATKAAIIETRSLGILKHAHSLRPLEEGVKDAADFPSWALRLDRRRFYHINPISYRDFRFHANDYLPLIIWPNESPRVLRVQGVMFDIITDVSPQMQWRLYGDVSDTMTAAAVLHDTYAWTCEACPTWNEYLLARKFAITVAAGQDAKGRNVISSPEHGNRLCDGFINTAHQSENNNTKDYDSDAGSETSSRSADVKDFDTDLTNDNPDAVYALSAMIKSGHHRTVFVTQRGSLGLGTDNVLPGDVVCILFGGSVPFVLRKEAHFWRFVGDAFVEEIMEGGHIQTLKAQNRLEREKQWFKIR